MASSLLALLGFQKSSVFIAKQTYHPIRDNSNGNDSKQLIDLKRDDKLKLIEATSKFGPDGGKLYIAKNKRSGKTGLVSRLMLGEEGTIETEPWYFGKISREVGEVYLGADNNVAGSFLIRDSSKPGDFALDVKFYDENQFDKEQGKQGRFGIKHYLISVFQDGRNKPFLLENEYYSSLDKLVENLSRKEKKKSHAWLCCPLKVPCCHPGDLINKTWQISRKDLQFKDNDEDHFGEGQFGVVLKGKWRDTIDVAIKKSKANISDENRKDFLKEVAILKDLHHPNLVQVYAICVEKNPFLLVMEFMENGDLRKYMRHRASRDNVTFQKLIQISENIAAGMAELSRLKIVHRDLAARNVLLDNWLTAKVADFGLAREGTEYWNDCAKFPVRWTAPEAICDSRFTIASDVWSFGVVLYEIFSYGREPYEGIDKREVKDMIVDGQKLTPPDYPHCSSRYLDSLHKIMISCWITNPEERPCFAELRRDFAHFFEDFVESHYNNTPIDETKKRSRRYT